MHKYFDLTITYNGDSNYNNSSLSQQVNAYDFVLSLTLDDDTAIATFSDMGGRYYSNELVSFYNGDTDELLDTDYTDSNGEASYDVEVGVGSVYATCYGITSTSVEIDTAWSYEPLLDGTENITSWTNMTNKTENGIFYSHGSYLTEGWSNTGLWKLEFDCMCTTTSWRYVGLMPICSEEINPFTDAKNSSYSLTVWEGFTYPSGLGLSYISYDSHTKTKTINVWHHMAIEKLTSTLLKITLDNQYVGIGNAPNLANLSRLHIGSRDNPSSRNTGGIIQMKNIKVIEKPSKDVIMIKFNGTDFVSNNHSGGENYGIVGTNMEIDWGDGTIETLPSETRFTHTYASGGNHTILITGHISEIGDYGLYHSSDYSGIESISFIEVPNLTVIGVGAFYHLSGLTEITIPSSVTELGQSAFRYCSGLTSVSVPSSVTTVNKYIFRNCSNIVDYQLYWTNPPVSWTSTLMPNNTNAYYTIPNGATANYVAKSFPSAKLIERSP